MKLIKTQMLCATAALALTAVFETKKAGWKLDENGNIVLQDGQPVYVKEDGSETTIDGNTISRLNAESKGHRERAEKAENALKPFEGIDPVKAREALDLTAKIDQKTLIDAGKVDEVRNQITQQFTQQLGEKDATIATLTSKVDNMTLEGAFAKSKFIAERIAVPAEMFQATFQKNFKVEDGKIVPIGPDGNTILSKKRMGETADVDEAFEILVESYPHKESILKAPSQNGTGGGNGGQRGNGRYMSRADFDALSPGERANTAASAAKGEVTIGD